MNERLFFGREHEIAYLKDKIFTMHPAGHSLSLRGPNGVGKTYLKDHLLSQFRAELKAADNHSIFIVDMRLQSKSYYGFFYDIFDAAAKQLTDTIIEQAPMYDEDVAEELITYRDAIKSVRDREFGAEEKKLIDTMTDEFFKRTGELGLSFILFIDEFDNAREVFPRDTDDGLVFQKLFDFSAKTAAFEGLSVVLISRRRAGTIAHHMESGSNFDDAYPAADTTLRGFDDAEIEQYYQSFESLPCGLLNDDIKREIEFFVGRHPGMLMALRDHIRIYCKDQQRIRVADIYHKYGSGIRNTFSRMMNLISSEYVDRANEISAMSSFKQVFNIVPTYDANLQYQSLLLYDFGFVTEEDHRETKISEDIRPEPEKCLDVVREAWYTPLSKCFLIYIRENLPISEKNEVHRLIDATEVKFRSFLQKHLQRIHGNAWQAQIDTSEFNKDDFWENLQNDAREYGALSRGVEVNVLDVLAFYNLGKIVKQHWNQLEKYFPSFRNKKELTDSCWRLTKYRNCCMHGTLRILGVEQHNDLKRICGLLMADFDRYLDGKADEESLAEPLQMDTSGIHNGSTEGGQVNRQVASSAGHVIQSILSPLEFQARSEKYNGTEHDFKCETKKPRGNLIGTLIDINMPASIAPKDASKIMDADPVGKVYRVRIEQWDNGPMAQKFNVVPIV